MSETRKPPGNVVNRLTVEFEITQLLGERNPHARSARHQMNSVLPRACALLRLRGSPVYRSNVCIRILSNPKTFCTTLNSRNLSPVNPPDLSKDDAVDLDEFIGSPGWKLEDLLPPSRREPNQLEESITPQTLHHLLQLSGLPLPTSPEVEAKLLSALHDQLHFVRHVQSVSTENVEPLIRVGNENPSDDGGSTLRFEECVEESRIEEIPGLEWKQWDATGINGGSRAGRNQGWFTVDDKLAKEDD